jgi:hypothetical protein
MYNTKTLTYTLVCVVGFFFTVISGKEPVAWTRALPLTGAEQDGGYELVCTKARNGLISALKWGAVGAAVGAGVVATGGAAGIALIGAQTTAIIGGGAAGTAGIMGAVAKPIRKGGQIRGSKLCGLTKRKFEFRIERDEQTTNDDDDKRRVFVKFTNSSFFGGKNVQYAQLNLIGVPDKNSKRIKFVLNKLDCHTEPICDRWIWYGKNAAILETILKALWKAKKTEHTKGNICLKIKDPKKAYKGRWNVIKSAWKKSRWNRHNYLKKTQFNNQFNKYYWNNTYFGIDSSIARRLSSKMTKN